MPIESARRRRGSGLGCKSSSRVPEAATSSIRPSASRMRTPSRARITWERGRERQRRTSTAPARGLKQFLARALVIDPEVCAGLVLLVEPACDVRARTDLPGRPRSVASAAARSRTRRWPRRRGGGESGAIVRHIPRGSRGGAVRATGRPMACHLGSVRWSLVRPCQPSLTVTTCGHGETIEGAGGSSLTRIQSSDKALNVGCVTLHRYPM